MWIRHPHTKQLVLVLDGAHIKRLLDEGGVEELPPSPVPTPEPVAALPEKERVATAPARARKR